MKFLQTVREKAGQHQFLSNLRSQPLSCPEAGDEDDHEERQTNDEATINGPVWTVAMARSSAITLTRYPPDIPQSGCHNGTILVGVRIDHLTS